MTATKIPERDNCPSCGVQWVYYIDSNRYSRIIAYTDFEADRVYEYGCPDCDDRWPAWQ